MLKLFKQACFGGSLEKVPFSWQQRWKDGEKWWKMSRDILTEPESNHEICTQANSHSRWHLQLFFSFESKECTVSNLFKHNTSSDKVDLLAHPLGGRDPQTVLVRLKTTDVADLGDEVDIFPILGLLTLAPLVFPIKVIEAAGQDEVSAGIRWPAGRENDKIIIIILKFGFNNLSWSFYDRLTRLPVRWNTAPRWPSGVTHAFKRTHCSSHLQRSAGTWAAEWDYVLMTCLAAITEIHGVSSSEWFPISQSVSGNKKLSLGVIAFSWNSREKNIRDPQNRDEAHQGIHLEKRIHPKCQGDIKENYGTKMSDRLKKMG